ncbi:DUF934 domain-containing protein [Sansalvadorimonas sp. 2012CJ34-2]|uniref:DUF934 domain-containing protein n=1 Tax=Parendozoicomonas callyspongiae TaxID=2942213 RepID=A0ABT0PFQ6_9GAMM|nr:DUF934 domain-containing protein [Sansalvadorimonas sp. 2012CJ34-2]MCL6269846.1 DUF934 domain-containing protein [Sansalvadorimonas sp. 2012CJ34-2]
MKQAIELTTEAQFSWAIAPSEQKAPFQENTLVSPEQLTSVNKEDRWKLGLITSADTPIDSVGELVKDVPVVAINFHAFTDGRGFTLARLLRERLDFTGKIIATGQFLPDQVHYFARCGFSGFVLPDQESVDTSRTSLNAFSEAYQISWDRPEPLFRRM